MDSLPAESAEQLIHLRRGRCRKGPRPLRMPPELTATGLQVEVSYTLQIPGWFAVQQNLKFLSRISLIRSMDHVTLIDRHENPRGRA